MCQALQKETEFNAKCDCYYKKRQNVMQSVTGITKRDREFNAKCDRY